jgi:hypothetical protein
MESAEEQLRQLQGENAVMKQQLAELVTTLQQREAQRLATPPREERPLGDKHFNKPPEFEASPTDLRDVRQWLYAMRMYLGYGCNLDLNAPRSVATAASFLVKKAAKWWSAHCEEARNDLGGFTNFDQFANLIRSWCTEPNQARSQRDALERVRQTGSVQSLYQAMVHLWVGLPTHEDDKVYEFIKRLKDPSIVRELNVRQPRTLQEAYRMAHAMETSSRNPFRALPVESLPSSSNSESQPMELGALSAQRSASAAPRPGNTAGANFKKLPRSKLSLEQRAALMAADRANGTRTCLLCGKPGHWKNECPSAKK